MTDGEKGPARLGLGHFVALGGLGVCLVIAVWQLIWSLTRTKGFGNILNLLLQGAFLGLLLVATAAVVLMAVRNRRLYVLVYVMAGAALVMHLFSVVSAGGLLGGVIAGAGRSPGMLNFYFVLGLIGLVVGNRAAAGGLALPGRADLKGVGESLHLAGDEKPAAPETPADDGSKEES